jgi:S-methylmethionine-dependent homocysteine/selenocysteine methylase
LVKKDRLTFLLFNGLPCLAVKAPLPMIILDGGMSRELQRLGASFRQPEWSALALMEAPELVQKAHAEFAAAGAEIITTNSYALVPFHIGEARFQAQGPALASLAGKMARQAADAANEARPHRRTQVAGCLPPIFGSYRPDLFDANRAGHYLAVLIAGLKPFVDLWLGETLSSIAEARAVVEAVKGDGKKVWISFTLKDDAAALSEPPKLRSGETVEQAAAWAADAKIGALLFNCSAPEVMAPAVKTAAGIFRVSGSAMPIGVYANAFKAHDPDQANVTLSGLRQDLDPKSYCGWADQWVASGASIIGGCCGIGAGHIHALSRHLRCDAPNGR